MNMKMRNDNIINTRVDKYITTLLNKAKEYDLSSNSRKILNFVVYLLLNTNFQYILRSFRLGLGMPIDGFETEEEITIWKIKFKEMVDKYHSKKTIEPGMKSLICQIEKKMGGVLVYSEKSVNGVLAVDMHDDTITMVAQFMLEFLKFKNTKNVIYWLEIIKRLLLFDSPEKVLIYLQSLGKTAGEQDVFIELRNNRTIITMVMYPDTTFKDLRQLVEDKRDKISKQLKEIRNSSIKNQAKTSDIKRDYFIYKTYIDHRINRGRDENYYFNVSKAEAVRKEAEKTTDKSTSAAKYLEPDSIRKIVNRMKQRIKNVFPNNPEALSAFLGP